MHLVWIPNTEEATRKSFPVWFPFLKDISRRSKEPVEELMRLVARREVQLALIWNDDQAHALIGIRINRRGADLIGEIVWLAGHGMKAWFDPILPQLEQYITDLGCAEIRFTGRQGWSKHMKPNGYKIASIVMEKPLCPAAAAKHQ